VHILVTGAGGFSGSHIVPVLLGRGHRVTAHCGRSRGRFELPAGQPAALEAVLTGDLSTDTNFPSDIDAIIHTAGRSPGPNILDDQLYSDNVRSMKTILTNFGHCNISKFINFSSLSVLGDIVEREVDETTPIRNPDTYGKTKRQSEILLAEQLPHANSLSIRLPGVLGKNSVRNWLTNVLGCAKEGRDISYFNPDAAFNNAVHISSLCDFVATVLEQDWSGHEIITIGADGNMTIREMVKTIVRLTESRSRLVIAPTVRQSFLIQNTRAREKFGYEPMNMHEMLEKFIAENV